MSWASHPTTEMPAQAPPPDRPRPSRRRFRLVLAAVIVAALAGGALVLPRLLGPADEPTQAAATGLPAEPTIGSTSSAAGPTTPARSTPAAPVPAGTADSTALEAAVFTLTNDERASNGCPALRWDTTLATVARAHSVAMATVGFFGHEGANGSDPGDRMSAAGYDESRGWAENIARGQDNAQAVVAAWLASSDHRANMLNCAMIAIGVGVARSASGQRYWTQDFGGR